MASTSRGCGASLGSSRSVESLDLPLALPHGSTTPSNPSIQRRASEALYAATEPVLCHENASNGSRCPQGHSIPQLYRLRRSISHSELLCHLSYEHMSRVSFKCMLSKADLVTPVRLLFRKKVSDRPKETPKNDKHQTITNLVEPYSYQGKKPGRKKIISPVELVTSSLDQSPHQLEPKVRMDVDHA